MGRQIQFHTLPQDLDEFLKHVQQKDPVVLTEFNSHVRDVGHHRPDTSKSEMLCLWNLTLLPSLERKFIPESNRGSYYRVDYGAPILELSPSMQTTWLGTPALLQGRVYGQFQDANPGHRKWFDSISGWIRRRYTSNPLRRLGGYLGPYALEWFERGGILLPTFIPPGTPAWRAFIESQHRAAGTA
jgi:hypothetical protein